MTYRFETISLRKYYVYILISQIIAIPLFILVFAVLLGVLQISVGYISILMLILFLITSYFVFSIIDKKLVKEIVIKISSKKIIIDENHIFSVEDIKKISVTSKWSFTNYPLLKIYFNDRTYRIRSNSKYEIHFEKMILHLQTILKENL